MIQHETALRADYAAYGWSMTRDVGSRLPIGDAMALAYRAARDPNSMLTLSIAERQDKEREAEATATRAKAARQLSPMFAKYFTTT